jgi:polyisoprenoid-binding protein YceI
MNPWYPGHRAQESPPRRAAEVRDTLGDSAMRTLLERPAARPETGTWVLDPATAAVRFRGRAHRFAPVVSAVFQGARGTLSLLDDGHGSVDVDVDVASLTTGCGAYDEVLARVDPFDAVRHPIARFSSTHVAWSAGQAAVDGTLSVGGGSAPVTLSGSYRATGERTVLQARGTVDRRALGLSVDVPGLGLLLPARLDLHVDVQAVRAPWPPAYETLTCTWS